MASSPLCRRRMQLPRGLHPRSRPRTPLHSQRLGSQRRVRAVCCSHPGKKNNDDNNDPAAGFPPSRIIGRDINCTGTKRGIVCGDVLLIPRESFKFFFCFFLSCKIKINDGKKEKKICWILKWGRDIKIKLCKRPG